MRRAIVVAALMLMLGTAWQPLVLGSPPSSNPGSPVPSGPRAEYHTYASMVSELQALRDSHPDLVRMESIGKTYEGRDIWAVKLSDDVGTNDTAEPDVLIFGALHAREVMAVEVPLFALNYIIDGYGKNETLTKYVNTRETWFVPMANPDGHVYIEQGHDWRKNRRPTAGGNMGVDLNRNWGYMFGVDAYTSPDPASDVYHGPYPFSENETIAIRDLALRQRFATSLSFHSVASLVLYPWGFTDIHCPDYSELDTMARTMAAWNGYTPEQSSMLYFTHGDSEDWLYANTSAKAFTIELDTDFHPDPSHIPVSCALNREAVLYLVGYPNASIKDAGIFSLVSPRNGSLAEPDRPLNFSVKVMNYGTEEEIIPVEMEIANGSYIFRNSTGIRLRAGQVGQVDMAWSPPMPGAENYTFNVRTNLTGDGSAWNDRQDGQFRIRAKYGASLAAAGNTTLSCYPGENVTYPLNVTSLSNREDTILFVVTGYPLEWVRLPASVRLPPAGRTSVDLAISVPRNARPGDIASISVRAQSSTGQGAPGLVSTTTRVLDPSPVAVAGRDVTVNVTQEVAFDGSASRTPLGNLTRYAWDFGDGNRSEGARVRHAYSRRGHYVANLTVTNDRGWEGRASLNVTVNQSFRIELSFDHPSLKVLPGKGVTVNVNLKNAGNGPDRFLLSLEAVKWDASLEVRSVDMAAGEARAVGLTVTAPADSPAGTAALFRVKAASQESVYTRADALFTAVVDEVRSLDLSIPDGGKAADAGTAASFTALVQNRGNVAENLTLAAGGVPEGWTVRFSRDNVSVPPWNGTSVRITVDIPPGELAGEYSLAVNGIGLNITVRARYGLEAAADPQSVEVRPGKAAIFNLTLKNTGNAPADVSVAIAGLPAGWLPSGIQVPPGLRPGGNATLTVVIQVPAGARPGSYDMRLEARIAADSNLTATVPVQVKVLGTGTAPVNGTDSWLPLLLAVLVIVMVAAVAAGAAVRSARRRRRAAVLPPEPVPTTYGSGGDIPAAEAVPMTYGSGGAVPAAEPVPAAGAAAAPAAGAYQPEQPPAARGQAPGPVLCLWCFKKVRGTDTLRQCAGCGALLHADCAAAAGTCPRCGWQV